MESALELGKRASAVSGGAGTILLPVATGSTRSASAPATTRYQGPVPDAASSCSSSAGWGPDTTVTASMRSNGAIAPESSSRCWMTTGWSRYRTWNWLLAYQCTEVASSPPMPKPLAIIAISNGPTVSVRIGWSSGTTRKR